MTAIGLWQVWFYVALRGWPFAGLTSRSVRLPVANAAIVGAGVVTYIILRTGLSLGPQTVSAVAGSALAAVLLYGMLFDGLPRFGERRAREGLITLAAVTLLSAGVYAGLTALAHLARWTTATPTEWVTYAGLNAIGLGVILHVGIGRRWPFATTGGARRSSNHVDA
jgi:hypothetical protein